MKKITFAVIAIAAFAASAFVAAFSWKADEKNSTVSWEIPAGNKNGTFSNLKTSIQFDPSGLQDSKISASIEVNTIKAGNEQLETHLLSPDFFNSSKFPQITF